MKNYKLLLALVGVMALSNVFGNPNNAQLDNRGSEFECSYDKVYYLAGGGEDNYLAWDGKLVLKDNGETFYFKDSIDTYPLQLLEYKSFSRDTVAGLDEINVTYEAVERSYPFVFKELKNDGLELENIKLLELHVMEYRVGQIMEVIILTSFTVEDPKNPGVKEIKRIISLETIGTILSGVCK